MLDGRDWNVRISWLVLTSVTFGCAANPAPPASAEASPPTAEPEASEAPDEGSEPPAAPAGEEEAPASPATEAAPAPRDPKQNLADALRLCEEMCVQMDGSCAGRAAEFCRASCGDYQNAARTCPVEVATALSCQATADDFLLCSNISAPSCARYFKRLEDCRSGAVPPAEELAPEAAESNALPSGYTAVAVTEFGVSQVLPEGSQFRERSASALNVGTSWEGGVDVALFRLPDEPLEPTPKRVLKNATQFLGNDCQPKLRLRGRFETQGVVHIRFDTVCKDGTQKNGMFHFFDSKVFALQVLTPSGQTPPPEDVMDAMRYGFERKQ